MKKNKSKFLTGALLLATELALTSCGSKTPTKEVTTEIEENVVDPEETFEEFSASSTLGRQIADSAMANADEFSRERELFEVVVNNYEMIYTDEFRSLDNITIDWDSKSQAYAITAGKSDLSGTYELSLTDESLINFLIHQTSCKTLSISHAPNNNILSSLSVCDTITNVYIENCNFNSLEGLGLLTNTEKLCINNCANVTDITPLESLTKLRGLGINGTKITNVNALANLNQLSAVNLRFNELTDISGLESLDNIINLNLEFNKISSVEELSGLIAKGYITEETAEGIVDSSENQRLTFSTNNYQEDARILLIQYLDSKEAYVVALRDENQDVVSFTLTPDSFDFYSLTDDTPNCKAIQLSNIPADYIPFSVAHPEKYDAMTIEHCDFDNLHIAHDFDNLVYLSVADCPNIVDVFDSSPFGIHNLHSLETLRIKGTNINDLDSLTSFESIKYLELKNNDITDYGFLMYMPNLEAAILTPDNYPVDTRPLETIQENGVFVNLSGYELLGTNDTTKEESTESIDQEQRLSKKPTE